MTPASVPPGVPGSKPKKLLDQTRDVLRLKHYSLRTERSYCDWIERFIRFHRLRHPREMGVTEITQFLTHLARIGNVSAATQNQALSALLFLYQKVLKQEVGWIDQVERAKKPKRIPMVLTRDEVHKIFAHMHGTPRLMAGLLYGSGLRLMECVRLRVKDVDFGYARITVRDGKGAKDRLTYVLRSLKDNQFYVGLTRDVPVRVQQHNNGLVTSTKKRTPFELVYWEGCLNESDAGTT